MIYIGMLCAHQVNYPGVICPDAPNPISHRNDGLTYAVMCSVHSDIRICISVWPRKVCFFRCYLWGSSLKDTVMRWKRFGIGNGISMKELDGGPIISGG